MHMSHLSAAPAEIARMACRWELQQRRLDHTGDWHYVTGTSSGRIQLGPFRRGAETTQGIELDFLIHHNWPEYFEFRIAFELDAERGINDPNRANNVTRSEVFCD